MSRSIQAIRGMNDLLPDVTGLWQEIEARARDVLHAYGYREIRLPLVEKTELFARSIGQATDIVEKEMYTFEDRNGDNLALRPEGTAGCVRAGIQHGLLHNQTQRFWYTGPMFRHERPQKGRYRQFHQIGVETFGMAGPDIDVELILLNARLWKALGLEHLTLELNSLGTVESRREYRRALVEYLEPFRDRLDEDSLRRLEHNPLRVLDSKNPGLKDIIAGAPSLTDYLDQESGVHFEGLCAGLDRAGIEYVLNPRLVRGLDYYTRTVFEWTTDRLGAQSAVCAGGRFDGLVAQLGGRPAPAAGFAIGLERLIELAALKALPAAENRPQVYFVLLGERASGTAMPLAERLRDDRWRVEVHCGGGSMKSQMKKADRSGARFAIIVGDDECDRGAASVKDLRAAEAQVSVDFDDLDEFLKQHLTNTN